MNAQLNRTLIVVGILLIASLVTVRAEWVVVERVIDGDTFVTSDGARVRVRGIDTPETRNPARGEELGGQRATDFARGALEGRVVHLEGTGRDQYGRRVADVTLPGGASYAGMVRSSGLDKKTNPYLRGAAPSTPQTRASQRTSSQRGATGTRPTTTTTVRQPLAPPSLAPVYTPARPVSVTPAASPSRNTWQTTPRTGSGSSGTVHVRGYTRSDGTYVAPHYRSAPSRRD